MPRYPTPADHSEDVYNFVSIDGVSLTKYPIRGTWSRQMIGRRGSREPRFSAYMSIVLEFGIDDEAQHNQIHDLWTGGGLHTVVMAAPDDAVHTTYTGVAIDDVTANRIDWYYENVRLVLSGILRP